MSTTRWRATVELLQVKAPGWDGRPTYVHVYRNGLLPEGVAQERIDQLLADDMVEPVGPHPVPAQV